MKKSIRVLWNYHPTPQDCGLVKLDTSVQDVMEYAEKMAKKCGKYFAAKSARFVDGAWLVDPMDGEFDGLDLNF